jgi:DNA-binding FadR family transcriptional regulator
MFKLVMPPLFVFLHIWFAQRFSGNPSQAEETLKKRYEDHCKLLAVLKTGNPREAREMFGKVILDYLQAIASLGTKPPTTKNPEFDAGPEPPDQIPAMPAE